VSTIGLAAVGVSDRSSGSVTTHVDKLVVSDTVTCPRAEHGTRTAALH
jgi:hypothetical protein